MVEEDALAFWLFNPDGIRFEFVFIGLFCFDIVGPVGVDKLLLKAGLDWFDDEELEEPELEVGLKDEINLVKNVPANGGVTDPFVDAKSDRTNE